MRKDKAVDLIFRAGVFYYDEEHKIETEHIGYENHFIDFNALAFHSEFLDETAKIMEEEIKNTDIRYDAVGGVPYTGAIFGYQVAKYLGKPYFTIDSNAHWEKALPDKKLEFILIDDVSASGGSLINSAKEVRKRGHDTHHAFTFYDKDLWAREKLKLFGVELHPLFELDSFLSMAVDKNYLTKEQVKNIRSFNNKKRDGLKFSPEKFLENMEYEKRVREKAAELRRELILKNKRDLGGLEDSRTHPKNIHVPFQDFQGLRAGIITPQEFEEYYKNHLNTCKFCRETFEDCITVEV